MEDKKLVKFITTRQTALERIRSPYEAMWKDIARFVSPDRDIWDTSSKEWMHAAPTAIYDGTPLSALNLMANGLQGYMASKSTKSFKVKLESFRTLSQQPYEGRVRQYMQDMEDVFYWMIDRSNFYDNIHEVFMNGGTFATSVQFMERPAGSDRILFIAEHIKNCWVAENLNHEVDTVHRKILIAARDIVKRWPNAVDDRFKKAAKDAPFKEHEVLHAVFPREDRDFSKIDNRNKAFASVWILKEGQVLLEESGFETNPFVVWRWSTAAGSTYGWGPSHNAMADILRSNQVSKSLLKAAQRQVEPPLNVPQEGIFDIDLTPNGMNPYSDPRKVITPIQTTGNYPIGIDREQALQQAIKEHYFVDMFLMLNQVVGKTTDRTATEVLEMQSEKAAIMGTITARIESEQFDPMFDRMFEIAAQAGWLPPPPPEMYEMLGAQELRIDYVGPMSQLQQRFYSQQSVDKPMARLMSYAEAFPVIMDLIDGEKLGRRIIGDSALPQDIVRSKRDTKQIQQQRAQMQQEAMQSELAAQQAQAVRNVSEANMENLKALQQEGMV